MDTIKYTKEISVKAEYDAVVCGGGVAGFCAAIQAARSGAKTAIIDKNNQLGGIMTVGGNNSVALFYAFKKQIIAGIGWELMERLKKKNAAFYPDFKNVTVHHALGISVAFLETAVEMENMCKEDNVDIYYLQPVCDTLKDENGNVIGVLILTKTGIKLIKAKQVIDCTGDGDVSYFAGAEYKLGDDDNPNSLQPGSFRYYLENINEKEIDRESTDNSFIKAVEDGRLSPLDYRCGKYGGVNVILSRGYNVNHIILNGADSDSISAAQTEARRRLINVIKWARTIKGAENCCVNACAPEVTPRETRRIIGNKYITVNDYLSGKVYDDSVCYSFYPIDLHTTDNASQLKNIFHEENIVPTIPLGAMTVKGFNNLWVAGRCISGDRLANSAYRVKSSCMAMGQAVGAAAALAVKHNCKSNEVPYDELVKLLADSGAIVPKKTN